jgi:hypothetical protein
MNEDLHEIMIDEEEDTEALATAEQSNIQKNENKSKKKSKKGAFNREWFKVVEYQPFLKEYKLDASQATYIACNQTILNSLSR